MELSIQLLLLVGTCIVLETNIQTQCGTIQPAPPLNLSDSNIKRIEGNNRRIKRSLFMVDCDLLASREACLRFCFNNTKTEVCQMSYSGSALDSIKCRAYPIGAGYVKAFSDRYMEDAENNRIYEVYIDGLKDDLPETKPVLFYPLDSLSQGANLGTLESKFSLNMGPTTPHFDCDANFSRQKVLRLVPNDKFLIQIPNASSLPTPKLFTFIVRMKKNDPKQSSAPIIEGSSANHTIAEWWLWNHNQASMAFAHFGREAILKSETLNLVDWNIVAFRVKEKQVDLFVNEKLVQSAAITTNVRLFGDNIYIGRRIGTPSGNGNTDYMFDGCIANMMMFTSALSDADISRYTKLVSDPNF